MHGGENLNYGVVVDDRVFTVGLRSAACSMQLHGQCMFFISVDPEEGM